MKQNDKKDIFLKSFSSLKRSFDDPVLTERDRAGVIQSFEFCFEATWKYLKVILDSEGKIVPPTPRKVFEGSFQAGVIDNQDSWLKMIKDRNLTTHTYDENLANEVLTRIQSIYLPLLQSLKEKC